MSTGAYASGLVVILVVLAACAATAWLVVGRTAPELRGSVRLSALAIVFTAALLAAHLLPALVGLLSRGAVVAVALLLLAGAAFTPRRPPGALPPAPASPPSSRLSLVLAWGAAGVLASFAVGHLLTFATVTTGSVDALSFHLPNIAAWIQSGSIWRIDQFVFDGSNGYYPQHGNLLMLAAILPWDDDAFVRPLLAAFYALGGVTTYALARELRAPASTAVAFAAVLLAVPAISRAALVDLISEPLLVAMLPAGLLFLLRHERSGLRRDLVLAGVALGLAFGTKWYGVSAVAVVLAGWAVARLVARRSPRVVLAQLAAVAALVLASGGVWLIRNWVEAGNPLFPLRPSLLGFTPFDAGPDVYRERAGFSLAHYATDFAVWRDTLVPAIRPFLGLAGGLLLVGGLAGAVWSLVAARRGTLGERRLLAIAAGALLLAGLYAITPYSAFGPEGRPFNAGVNVRYLIPALLLAAALAAVAAGRVGRWRPPAELAALVAVLGSAAATLEPTAGWLAVAAVVVVLAVLAAWLARAGRRSVPAVVAACCLVAAVAAVGGRELQQRYDQKRFRGEDPVIDRVLRDWPSGQRIAVAGDFSPRGIVPYAALMGPRLDNAVRPAGRFERGFMRAEPTRERFLARLRAGRYDLLVVGRGYFSQRPDRREERWARGAGYRRLAESRRMALYELPG